MLHMNRKAAGSNKFVQVSNPKISFTAFGDIVAASEFALICCLLAHTPSTRARTTSTVSYGPTGFRVWCVFSLISIILSPVLVYVALTPVFSAGWCMVSFQPEHDSPVIFNQPQNAWLRQLLKHTALPAQLSLSLAGTREKLCPREKALS